MRISPVVSGRHCVFEIILSLLAPAFPPPLLHRSVCLEGSGLMKTSYLELTLFSPGCLLIPVYCKKQLLRCGLSNALTDLPS